MFAKLLCNELKNADRNSRLQAHLPLIADALYKWSEKNSAISLWSVLGYANASSLPPAIRLFCRFTATFIASRLSIPHLAENALNEKIDALISDAEFKQWSSHLAVNMKEMYQDKANSIAHLEQVIIAQAQVLFLDELIKMPVLNL